MKVLIRVFATLIVSSILVSGCGAPPAPTSAAVTTATDSTAKASVTSPMYETKVFQPVFTVEVPPGWFVAERDRGAAQIFVACKTCDHEGEENGEITLDMALSNSSPSEAIARLQMAKNIDAGPSEPVEVGILSGFKFTAARSGKGQVIFQDSGYRTDAAGLPLEIYVVTASGRTVTIFIDPHESSGSAAQDFAKIALAVIKTIRFSD